jgi:hypothetical protein
MKRIGTAVIALAMTYAGTLGAQTSETTKTKTKTTIDGGKEITVAGCVERGPGGGYTLNDGTTRYALVGGKDLNKHVGHRVEVAGKTTDGRHGKVKVESKAESNRSEDTTRAKVEIKGDVHALGVKSLKMMASSCA